MTRSQLIDSISRRFRYTLLALVVVIFAVAGCTTEQQDEQSDECPPEMTYDAELERCISDDPNSNDGAGDAGGYDAGPTDPDASDPEDADPPGDDTGVDADAGGSDDDAGISCDDIDCGDNAYCEDAQCHCEDDYEGDPYDECVLPPPCDDDCEFGATCIDDQCVCDPGFTTVSDGCELEDVSDPADRTETEVCDRWNEDPWSYNTVQWADDPQDQCDWGWLTEEYHLEAIHETTRYRWVVGLPAVTTSENSREITQACATTLAAEGVLTHDVDDDFACYTSEGASGAASSNIATGSASAADTVSLYIEDFNVPSLGHRHWIYNPGLSTTGFGFRDGYSCMHVFDNSGSADPEFIAYPAEGYFPDDALHGKWSIASSNLTLNGDTDVTVEDTSDNSSVGVNDIDFHPGDMYRPPMVSWNVASPPGIGDTYEITIVDAYGDGDDLTYETTISDCP